MIKPKAKIKEKFSGDFKLDKILAPLIVSDSLIDSGNSSIKIDLEQEGINYGIQ